MYRLDKFIQIESTFEFERNMLQMRMAHLFGVQNMGDKDPEGGCRTSSALGTY